MMIGSGVNMLLSKVEEFKQDYHKKHLEDPDSYPLDLDEQEWEEQFVVFIGWA